MNNKENIGAKRSRHVPPHAGTYKSNPDILCDRGNLQRGPQQDGNGKKPKLSIQSESFNEKANQKFPPLERDGYKESKSYNTIAKLYERSQKITDDDQWLRFVRVHLRLSEFDISAIQAKYPGCCQKQREALLMLWTKQEGEKATVDQFDKLLSQLCGGGPSSNVSPGSKSNTEVPTKRISAKGAAIARLKQSQKEIREPVLQWLGVAAENQSEAAIPVVHPKMCYVELYKKRETRSSENDEACTFDDLLCLQKSGSFFAVVGHPGSGKSTCLRRLERAMDAGDGICLSLDLQELTSHKRSLRDLLLYEKFPGVDKETLDLVFEWMIENQKKCAIVMDSLDYLSWSLKDATVKQATYGELLPPVQLIANLLGRKYFFPKVGLVIASRRHSVLALPGQLRPDKVIELQELSSDNMIELFRSFNLGNSEEWLRTLAAKSPLLLDLCHNPLILKLVIEVLEHDADVSEIHTTTGMFKLVLDKLQRTSHWRRTDLDFPQLMKQISALAFAMVDKGFPGIDGTSLLKEDLTGQQLQNLLSPVVSYNYDNEKLLGTKDATFHFTHMTWAEYLAAFHLSQHVDVKTFEDLLDDVVHNSKWLMVRKFLCGQLLNVPSSQLQENEKAFLLYKTLKDLFEAKDLGPTSFLYLIEDFLECSDEVAKKFAKLCPQNMVLARTKLNSGGAYALARMLRLTDKTIDELDLRNCEPSLASLKHICDAIVSMKHKIKVLDLSFNHFTSEATDILCRVIPHLTSEFFLRGAFDYGNGMVQANNQDRSKLRRARRLCANWGLQIYRVYDHLI